MKRMGKDVKFRMMFKGDHSEESYNWSVPHSIIRGFCLKILLVAGFVIGFIF